MRAQSTLLVAICLPVLSAAPLLAADKVALNVKEGLWETTTTHSTSGMPGMSDDTLAKLPPDQRARVEEMMKQKGVSMNGNTTTAKHCVTKEKIEKGMAFASDSKQNCTRDIVDSSPSHVQVKYRCEQSDKNGQKTTSQGTVDVNVVSADTTKGTIHNVMNSNGHDMTMDMTFTSRYLGPSCGDIN
jgi:hypothetical protein